MAIAAVGQITSTSSLIHNLEQCVDLVKKAAAGNAKVLFLPEASDYIASSAQESLSLVVPQATSPFVLGLQNAARDHSVAISVGIHVPASTSHTQSSSATPTTTSSIPDVAAGGDATGVESFAKLINRSLWINPDGTINEPATYDKLHLFDYGSLRESTTVQAGNTLTPPFKSPIGRIGSLICFDLRFPEPALALSQPGPSSPFTASSSSSSSPSSPSSQPAQILLYPSAFTPRTGAAHWEVLLRARAIETQSWVIAAAQAGAHNEKRSSYGHSMVVDPWGVVRLDLGPEGGRIGFVDVDLDDWARVREEMPLLRRRDVYTGA